jgi:CRP-like cAMP-binding protein
MHIGFRMNIKYQQYRTILSKSSTFGGLPLVVEELLTSTTESKFAKSDLIFRRGDAPTGVHVLAVGHVKLCIDDPMGDEHVIEILQPGESFGEAAVLTDRPHLLSAIAIDDCSLLHVSGSHVRRELEHNHSLAQHIIGVLSGRLYRRTGDMENVLLRKALGRVAKFLLTTMETNGCNNDSAIELEVGKGLIASQLNMTQEHFSRTLHELTVRGKISVHGRRIAILNEAGLRRIAA